MQTPLEGFVCTILRQNDDINLRRSLFHHFFDRLSLENKSDRTAQTKTKLRKTVSTISQKTRLILFFKIQTLPCNHHYLKNKR